MKKDAYFFPHFSNARHDRKLKRVIKDLGPEGYGLYFMLLEVLREQVDFRYPLSDVDLLAEEFKTTDVKLNAVIRHYDLFQVDENENFISLKLVFYLQPYIEASERARLAARKRWDNVKAQLNDANAYANALPEQSKSNAVAMQGEDSKGEEKRVKKSIAFIPPTLEQIKAYCLERENSVDAERFFDFFDASDWVDSKGNKVRNWKQKVITWESNNNNNKSTDDKPLKGAKGSPNPTKRAEPW
jgi:hypothetical protein